MQQVLSKCGTTGCTNMAQGFYCSDCARATQLSMGSNNCSHGHSVTGDFEMIKRLLPAYAGGPPQDGFMLDVCKLCLKELPERPYTITRHHPARRH